MPWASRLGNSFTVLFEIKNIKDKTPERLSKKMVLIYRVLIIKVFFMNL